MSMTRNSTPFGHKGGSLSSALRGGTRAQGQGRGAGLIGQGQPPGAGIFYFLWTSPNFIIAPAGIILVVDCCRWLRL